MSDVGSNIFHTLIQRFVTYELGGRMKVLLCIIHGIQLHRDKQTCKIVGLYRSENKKDAWETDSQQSAVQETHTFDNKEHNLLYKLGNIREAQMPHIENYPN